MRLLPGIQPSQRNQCQDPFIYPLTACFWNSCPGLAPGLPVCGCRNEEQVVASAAAGRELCLPLSLKVLTLKDSVTGNCKHTQTNVPLLISFCQIFTVKGLLFKLVYQGFICTGNIFVEHQGILWHMVLNHEKTMIFQWSYIHHAIHSLMC